MIRKNEGIVVGFDFGTTNSLISLIQAGQAIPCVGDDGQPIPSVICYEGGDKIIGRPAKERLSQAGLGIYRNIVRSPKSFLGKGSVFVEGIERSPVDIVADVVRHVRDLAVERQVIEGLSSIEKAVVTIPISMDGQQRRALRDAFRKAGIAIVQFVHEPMAGLYDYFRSSEDSQNRIREYEDKLMLVFDWGGGTLDLTLCKIIDGMIVQLRNDGSNNVGGDLFDSSVRDAIIRRARTAKGLSDHTRIRVGSEEALLARTERAKIDLSSRSSVTIFVRDFFEGVVDEDLEYELTRDELEEITEELVDRGVSRIRELLRSADVSPVQIGLCLATGGMVNMPKIKARLHELFEPSRVQLPKAGNTVIANGAAWVAHDEIPMQLAKNIELLVARQSRIVLIPAGTEMPKEGETSKATFHLYTTDPSDGKAYFQLESPVRPGRSALPNDRRNNLMHCLLNIDSNAKPFRERLELEVSIDDDLILSADVRSLGKRDRDQSEAYDLEFGLKLPSSKSSLKDSDTPLNYHSNRLVQHEPGELTTRSNITDWKDESLVPGEVLYDWKPERFNQRYWNPNTQNSQATKRQIDERLYYKPCALCRRASSDPLCQCISNRWGGEQKRGRINCLIK